MKKLEEKHLETLYNQIEILKGEMIINRESLMESAPEFIHNTISNPIVYRAISGYIQYKMDQTESESARGREASAALSIIMNSITISTQQKKILLNESASEFILYYFYLVDNS